MPRDWGAHRQLAAPSASSASVLLSLRGLLLLLLLCRDEATMLFFHVFPHVISVRNNKSLGK